MATLKCLACGHDNNVGDEWCSSCSSSLNLRLCSECEAINASDAERCHSCNAEFRIEPEVVTFEMDTPRSGDPVEQPGPVGRTLPAVWRMAADRARTPRSKSVVVVAAALALLPLGLTGVYYFYAASQAAQTQAASTQAAPAPTQAAPAPTQVAPAPAQVAPKVDAAQKSEPAPEPAAARKEPARPKAAAQLPAQLPDVKPAHAPVVSARLAAPRPAAAPARGTPPPEPKRTTAAVTHTRAAGAEISSSTAAAEAPARTAITTLPAAAASAPAANAVILPVSERVTHTNTKADLTESAATTAAPAAATQVRTVPPEARSDDPAGCPPAVAALALCKSK